MKSKKSTYLFLLFAATILAKSLEAQENLSLDFSIFVLPTQDMYAASPEGFERMSHPVYIITGGRYRELGLNILSQSGPYHYSGPSPMVLYHKTGDSYVPITSITIPEGLHDGLLIVEYSTPSLGGIKGYLIEYDENRFPNGSACLINRSEVPVIGLIGTNQLKLPPNANDIARPDISERSLQAVKLAFFDSSKENWKRLYSTAHRFREDTRVLVVLQSTGNSNRPVTFNLIELHQSKNAPTHDMQPDADELEEYSSIQ